MRSSVTIFQSLNLWDICALIAHSLGYCGSSLHGGIVAGAFALPHLYLQPADQAARVTKQAAYADTWGSPCLPATTTIPELAKSLPELLDTDPEQLGAWANALAAHYRKAFVAACPTGSR
jgi:hypothetical protein